MAERKGAWRVVLATSLLTSACSRPMTQPEVAPEATGTPTGTATETATGRVVDAQTTAGFQTAVAGAVEATNSAGMSPSPEPSGTPTASATPDPELPPYGTTSFVAPDNKLCAEIKDGVCLGLKDKLIDYVRMRWSWLQQGVDLRGDDFATQLLLPVEGDLSDRWPGYYDQAVDPRGRGMGFIGADLSVLRTGEELEELNYTDLDQLLKQSDTDSRLRGWAVVRARDVDEALWKYIQAAVFQGGIDPAKPNGIKWVKQLWNRVWYGDWGVADLGHARDDENDLVGPDVGVCQAYMGDGEFRLEQPDELLRWVNHRHDWVEKDKGLGWQRRDSDDVVLLTIVVGEDINGLRTEVFSASRFEKDEGEDETGRAAMERWIKCRPGVHVLPTPTPTMQVIITVEAPPEQPPEKPPEILPAPPPPQPEQQPSPAPTNADVIPPATAGPPPPLEPKATDIP